MQPIYYGTTRTLNPINKPEGSFISHDDGLWYRIENYDFMPAFFMSITNPDNIWMFLSSTGGLTCGRESADNALFPYLTVDKVTESTNHTGPITYFLVENQDKVTLWQPFDLNCPRIYDIQRNVWKSVNGDRVMFEELNHSLGLTFRMSWEASPRFGIHRNCEILSLKDEPISLYFLDGIRNILPAGANTRLQTTMSTLLDGYKRSESDGETKIGIYALSATLTDLAEPSESLQATTVWSYGLEDSTLLLGEQQIPVFLQGGQATEETDQKGQRGAYLLTGKLTMREGEKKSWGICAELKQDHHRITDLQMKLKKNKNQLVTQLHEDLKNSRNRLSAIIDMNDGHQKTGSLVSDVHHRANVLFNSMRGGYFLEGYTIQTGDFLGFAKNWNSKVFNENRSWFSNLPSQIHIPELHRTGRESNNRCIERLTMEYLPLTFSRRHGDPSRPWNQFFIRTSDSHGNPQIGYQGNWRDIFQNWEALCLSYPAFFPSIITKFLNATTIDGYNPYRVSENGIDWETPDPHDPWANIGYWSDHQIIYLTKLLEHCNHYLPGELRLLSERTTYVFADVPYRIKDIHHLLSNPYDSIIFDFEHHTKVEKRVQEIGADGKLIFSNGEILNTSFFEKLLILLLAKVANFVPGGGIWMNTQRPEWNDANNALAGWGVSMVTLSYLVRYIEMLRLILKDISHLSLHSEVYRWMSDSYSILQDSEKGIKDSEYRYRNIVSLGLVATQYRTQVYQGAFNGVRESIPKSTINDFLALCDNLFRKTMDTTQRADGSYESYLVLGIHNEKASLKQLYPMLEGQVSGLSVKNQETKKVIQIVENLKTGPLYREDQNSYMLYPNRELPGYLAKNCVCQENAKILNSLENIPGINSIVQKDSQGVWHFTSTFRNVHDVYRAAADIPQVQIELLAKIFEETFNHAEFTGRSGTFFAFEGLGSIYWHMVSKLLLAVQEQLVEAILNSTQKNEISKLKELYISIRSGIGFNKTPDVYGAFPTDPYSHTPWGSGAKQPGMTGQVKEEIITRFGELGLLVKNGRIHFIPQLILDDQWDGSNSLSYTFCQIPISIRKSKTNSIKLSTRNKQSFVLDELSIPEDISLEIFTYNHQIEKIEVNLDV